MRERTPVREPPSGAKPVSGLEPPIAPALKGHRLWSTDALLGIAWWNGLTESERAEVAVSRLRVPLQAIFQMPPERPAGNSTGCRPGTALQRVGNLIAAFDPVDVALCPIEQGRKVALGQSGLLTYFNQQFLQRAMPATAQRLQKWRSRPVVERR